MKRILAPILLLTFLFPSLAYGLTIGALVQRDGLYYKKFTDVPFTGKITGNKQGSFKDGKKVGPWTSYHRNGQLKTKGTYKDGKKNGLWVRYHDNGKLHSKSNYKDGKRDGPFIFYFYTGQLGSKGTYKNDKRDGPWVFYEVNGTKRFTKDASGGVIFHEGSGTYKNGKKISD